MKYFTSIFLTLVVAASQAQTKQELLDKLDKNINGINSILKVSQLRIEFSTAIKSEFDPNDGFNFKQNSIAKPSANREQLEEFFTKNRVKNWIVYPYNVISFPKKEYDLSKLIRQDNQYFTNKNEGRLQITPTKVTFVDGSSMDSNLPIISKKTLAEKHSEKANEDGKSFTYVDTEKMNNFEQEIWKSSSFEETIALLSPKPIKNISYHIEITIPNKVVYELNNQNKTAKTAYGIVTLDTIIGNKISCTIPSTDSKNSIQIEAYYQDGRALNEKSSSSYSIVTEEKKEVYEQWLKILEDAKKLVNDEKITSDKSLVDYYNTNPIAQEDQNLSSYKRTTLTFSGPVNKVAIIVADSNLQKEEFDVNFPIKYNSDHQTEFLAVDEKLKKTGLINQKGEWIISPQFNEYFRPINQYFYTDQIDRHNDTYRYNPTTKNIQKVDYNIDNEEILKDKYLIIKSKTNGKKGVVDATTGVIMLPMEYDYIRFQSNKYWNVEQNEKEGIFDQNFKIIFDIAYESIRAKGDFFYEHIDGSLKNVYNSQGKSITKNKYSGVSGQFADNLLLVDKYIRSTSNSYTHYFYIDSTGTEQIDVNAKGYESPFEFSSGLAVVRNKDGRYGYINTKGDLVIPFQYEYAWQFFKTSQFAIVKLNNENYVLIDKKGKLVKQLPGDYIKGRFKDEKGTSRILMEKEKSFNEYGEEVPYNSNDYW